MKYLVVEWSDVHKLALKLSDLITIDGYFPDILVAIARGGWVVARLLSDFLGVEEVASVRVEFYEGINKRKGEARITQPVSASVEEKKVLLVDDVADTGESLRVARSHLYAEGAVEVKVATLHKKPWSKVTPDYYAEETDAWIIYPWELRETIANLVENWRHERPEMTEEEIARRLVRIGLDPETVHHFLPLTLDTKPAVRRVPL